MLNCKFVFSAVVTSDVTITDIKSQFSLSQKKSKSTFRTVTERFSSQYCSAGYGKLSHRCDLTTTGTRGFSVPWQLRYAAGKAEYCMLRATAGDGGQPTAV